MKCRIIHSDVVINIFETEVIVSLVFSFLGLLLSITNIITVLMNLSLQKLFPINKFKILTYIKSIGGEEGVSL